MPVIKLSLSEEQDLELLEKAQNAKMTKQDFIRKKIFEDNPNSIFNPEEAERRACESFQKGEQFSLPRLYGGDWVEMEARNGMAGVFGKRFFEYVKKYSDKIKFIKMVNNRALYEIQ